MTATELLREAQLQLEAMADQIGHPDYSLKELHDGLRRIAHSFHIFLAQPEPQAMSAEEVREACAKICERLPLTLAHPEHPSQTHTMRVTEAGCRGAFAEAIRALDLSRKENKNGKT